MRTLNGFTAWKPNRKKVVTLINSTFFIKIFIYLCKTIVTKNKLIIQK